MAQGQKFFYGAIGVVIVAGGFLIYQKMGGSGPISYPVNVAIIPSDTSGFRGYLLGDANAPVEVTEYADLQCPACQLFATVQFPEVKKRLIDTGKMRLRYRDFPLDGRHSNPRVAAHATACANDQGKFWEMEAAIYQQQDNWSPMSNPMPAFKDIATKIGVDAGKWQTCMEAKTYSGRIQASLLEGEAVGVGSTPSFVIGGRVFEGMNSDMMAKIVDSIIASKQPASSAVKKP